MERWRIKSEKCASKDYGVSGRVANGPNLNYRSKDEEVEADDSDGDSGDEHHLHNKS